MMPFGFRGIGVVLLAMAVVGPTVAMAQTRREARARAASDAGTGYRVVSSEGRHSVSFRDDPLHALGNGANTGTIEMRKGASKVTLIRPRASFVPEMLKSVEHL